MSLNRIVICTINFIPISGIRIDYTVKKTDSNKPNTAEIKLYNLSVITKNAISLATDTPIQLTIGYWDAGASPLFIGRIKYVSSKKDEQRNIVTVIEAYDDAFGFNQGTSMVIPKGGTASTAIALMSTQMVAPLATPLTSDSVFLNGFSFIGSIKRCLDLVVKSRLKMTWFVDSGLLYVLDEASPTVQVPILLTPANGLLGQVEFQKNETDNIVSKLKKQEDEVSFRSLIIPRAGVGLTVTITSLNFTGSVKIKELEFVGTNRSGPSYTKYIGVPLI